MAENTRKLDLTRDFGTVVGDPEARYMQDFCMFDAKGEFLREMPESFKAGTPKPELSAEAKRAQEMIENARRQERAEAEALEQATRKVEQKVGRGGKAPASVEEATKENARALKAEQNAE